MTLELASIKAVRKPWGSTDLKPWSQSGQPDSPVGELWFERSDRSAPEPQLLLKLLFTEQTLSIQVHPDDAYAHALGQPHGKTEAWYVVSARSEARIALGLEQTLTSSELRAAIEDGSIADLVHWQRVKPDDAILVPAGTIHAIGAGLVIAEIQQRSDATFRLFDYGRQRELHVADAVAAAIAGPAAAQSAPKRSSASRRVLAASRYFVLEHVDLPPDSHWELTAESEAWLLVLSGEATFDLLRASVGEALFVERQSVSVRAEQVGLKGLIAYAASEPSIGLLRRLDEDAVGLAAGRLLEAQELTT